MKYDNTILSGLLHRGELGQLKLGMSVDDLLMYLGKPDRDILANVTDSGSTAYRYGCLSVATRDDRVNALAISISNFPEYGLPERFKIGWMLHVATIPHEDFVTLIQSHTNNNPYSTVHGRTVWRLARCTANTLPMLTITVFHIKESEDRTEYRQIIVC